MENCRITRWAVRLVVFICFFLLAATDASAHRKILYRIGDKVFAVNIGVVSRELVSVVDQMVALQIRVAEADETSGRWPDFQSTATTRFVPNIHETLRVEAIFGNERKTLPLFPAQERVDVPSAFFPFLPTAPGRYVFRLSGTINAIPIDIEIPCNPAGHITDSTSDDNIQRQLSGEVTQLSVTGSIACPESNSTVSFPEGTTSNRELSQTLRELGDPVRRTEQELAGLPLPLRFLQLLAFAGTGLALIALILVLVALWRSHTKNRLPY